MNFGSSNEPKRSERITLFQLGVIVSFIATAIESGGPNLFFAVLVLAFASTRVFEDYPSFPTIAAIGFCILMSLFLMRFDPGVTELESAASSRSIYSGWVSELLFWLLASIIVIWAWSPKEPPRDYD